MIACKKAQLEDLKRITYTVARLNKKGTTITQSEIKEYLDHTYYLLDTTSNYIVAVICACRVDRSEDLDPLNSVMLNTRRYEIVYFVHDIFCEMENLLELVRELLADMNDFITVYKSPKELEGIEHMALRSNNFSYNKTLKCYFRHPIKDTSMVRM